MVKEEDVNRMYDIWVVDVDAVKGKTPPLIKINLVKYLYGIG